MRARAMLLGIGLLLAGCVPAVDEPEERICGGLKGFGCGPGAYCSYSPEARCGAADQTGVCMPRPEACTMQYDPVCGCDGRTYSNACTAASAGVSVAHAGQCRR